MFRMLPVVGRVVLLGLAISVARAEPAGERIAVTTCKSNAIYAVGERIGFSVSARDTNGPVAGSVLAYQISGDGGLAHMGVLTSSVAPLVVNTALSVPGWVTIEVQRIGDNGRPVAGVRGRVGAMADPHKIRPGGNEPPDFDAFWSHQRELLNQVPIRVRKNPVEVPERYRKDFECFDVQIDCLGDVPVSGYLCLPKAVRKGSLAILVNFHGYGVFSAHKDFSFGPRYAFFNINANGLENGQSAEYYREIRSRLGFYPLRNVGDPQKYYMRFMYLRALRALDYVKTLPQWDGRNLVVQGASQGGAQALAAAALDTQVSLCWCSYPAMCDLAGDLEARHAGWPVDKNAFLRDNPDLRALIFERTLGYFDGAFFARRIRCETYMATGFLDTICAPTTAFAVYNSLPERIHKAISTEPYGGHSAVNVAGDRRIREIGARASLAEAK